MMLCLCVRIMLLLFVVLVACLASPALSRRQPLEESESAVAVTTTPVDESKLNIVFCILADCRKDGQSWQDCYCCGNVYQTNTCHRTLEECKAHCPLCNPRCSPAPPTAAVHGWTRARGSG